VAEYYPRRRDPVLGTWAHRQAVAARDAGAEVRVLVLERPVPPVAVVRDAARGHPGALGRSVRELARQPRLDELDGIPVEYVRFVAPPRERAYAGWDRWARGPLTRALRRLDARFPIELVHAHYALPAGGAAWNFCRERRLPLAVSVHGGDVLGPALSSPRARGRVGGVLARSSVVLCNSEATLARCAALTGSEERMRVVHLGADAPPGPFPRREVPTLVTLAHLVPRKRHADVLRALRLLLPQLPDLRWVVIGDGPELPALERLAAELGVDAHVEWAGQLAPRAALEALCSGHLMVMPSVDEAFGVAYVEALACGLPALGSRGEGGPEEIAALGGGMVLVPPADVEALAGAIAEVMSSPPALRALSEAARRTARAHFTWEACGRATVAAYAEALGRPAP
jgi:glycosyltransferase involved in cell wall biosynthesis